MFVLQAGFQFLSAWTSEPDLKRGDSVSCPLIEFLSPKVALKPSAKWLVEDKRENWQALFDKPLSDLQGLHPPDYEHDLARIRLFIEDAEIETASHEGLQKAHTLMDYHLAALLAASCPHVSGEAREILRYELQDLMNQSACFASHEFNSQYKKRYSDNNMLALGINDDTHGFCVKLKTEPPHLTIRCISQFKILDMRTNGILGYDTQTISFAIDFRNLSAHLLLLSPNCVVVTNQFHGFRKKLDGN